MVLDNIVRNQKQLALLSCYLMFASAEQRKIKKEPRQFINLI